MIDRVQWPDTKAFAFTVFDDTDNATLQNINEVYALLADLGFRTTKSVWPSHGEGPSFYPGMTAEDTEYAEWLLKLQEQGFEIGYHLNSYGSSLREETAAGLHQFAAIFGHSPVTMANHADCEESIHWGSDRLTGVRRLLYNCLTRFQNRGKFRGHIEGDKFFWGDLCRAKITYCRDFVFPDINTLKFCPFMPYHDPRRPYVNYWYASSEGANVDSFNNCLAEKNQDRLEEEGGACIMYTHFASGFYDQGKIHTRFKTLMKRLGRKNGWFVSVAALLDYLRQTSGHHELTNREQRRLERKWLWHKIHTSIS